MFSNPKDTVHSGSNPSERIPQMESQNRSTSKNSRSCAFEDRQELAEWIDNQLATIEKRYQNFETQASVRGHFSR